MEIACEFAVFTWNRTEANYYGCSVIEASITKPGTEIKAFVGEHDEGKTNNDVEMISFEDTVVEYIPRSLHKIFPIFKVLQIENCGLKQITRKDFKGLENLEILFLDKCKLRSLPADLFEGMVKLKEISLYKNQLEILSSKMLESVAGNELEKVNFRGNTKINAFYQPGEEESVASLQELMDIIDSNCDLPFDDLWTSGQYSDLIVIGGACKSKEFRVHKFVLAAHSRVLALSFPENQDIMKITDFSTDAVEQLLRFIYTGRLKKWNAIEVFAIAAKYDVKLLKDRAEEIIAENVNASNALEIFSFGHQHNSDVIKCAAFREIKKMFPGTDLQDSLIDQPEDLKNIIDIHRKLLNVQHEMEFALKKFKK
jgi:Leucine-rich repeat (LRR) protein